MHKMLNYILSSPRLLNAYLKQDKREAWDIEFIKQVMFTHARETNKKLPDYVYEGRIDALDIQKSLSKLLLKTFKSLATPLRLNHQRLGVKNELFSEWQNTLTQVTPLPMIAYFACQQYADDNEERTTFLAETLCNTCLPSPYFPLLDDMIQHEKLRELHIHINGTTEVDRVWEDLITHPLSAYKYLKKSQKDSSVQVQYLQLNDDLSAIKLYPLLKLANQLRLTICEAIKGKQTEHNKNYFDEMIAYYANDLTSTQSASFSSKHPYNTETDNPLLAEALFYCDVFDCLSYSSEENGNYHEFSFFIARSFHLYLLIKNYVNQLLVQQVDQYGFDQFQKITKNEIREYSEERYCDRFKQLQGMSGDDLTFVEARFAPKSTLSKTYQLMRTIIKDYQKAKQEYDISFDLGLIVHFIKGKNKNHDILHPCAFYQLRKQLAKQAKGLLLLIKIKPEIKQHFTGIDAASNELHTPPEVFAPIFRYMKKQGITNATYHVGEDFIHLLSGIRAIYEAMIYLDLENGNRIGHATAIGIDPTLWLDRSVKQIHIAQGEWLDNLIFFYHVASQEKSLQYLLPKIESQLQYHAQNIFEEHSAHASIFVEFWKHRWLDPLDLKQSFCDIEQDKKSCQKKSRHY